LKTAFSCHGLGEEDARDDKGRLACDLGEGLPPPLAACVFRLPPGEGDVEGEVGAEEEEAVDDEVEEEVIVSSSFSRGLWRLKSYDFYEL